MQIFLICILIKQQKQVAIKHFNHTFYETNFKPKLLTVMEQFLKNPKQKSKFKFSLNGGDLVFWFTFNLAEHFWPKMALTLEILSD